MKETRISSCVRMLSVLLVGLLLFPTIAAPWPAAAAGPTATPAAAEGDLIFQDDFSHDGGYLGTYQADDGQSQYAGGVYRMTVTDIYAYIVGLTTHQTVGGAPKLTLKDPLPANVSIEVDATLPDEATSALFGIGVGYQSDNSAYALWIGASGRRYNISKIEPLTAAQAKDPSNSSAFYWLAGSSQSAPHPAINTGVGATNHLRVDWASDGLVLYVNGQKLAEYPLEKPVAGDIALFAYALDQAPFEVDYRNLVVRRLPVSPMIAAVAPKSGQILYQEDFSDPESGWFSGADPTVSATVAYRGGAYHVSLKQGATSYSAPVDALRDVRAEVTITHLKGQELDWAGLLIRYIGDVNYDFLIRWDGAYMIGKNTVKGDYIKLVDWTQSATIKTGDLEKNTVRADCVGDTLTVYVNGQKVDQVQDADITAGYMGVEVGSPKEATTITEIAFNDFILRQP